MSTLTPSAFVAALALGAFLMIQPMLERLA